MKNKTKIIISGLAALLSIAYLVCSIVIPAETMEFMNHVGAILNYPITIAGVSMTIGGIIAYFLVNVILKTTKFGRKELDNIKKENNTGLSIRSAKAGSGTFTSKPAMTTIKASTKANRRLRNLKFAKSCFSAVIFISPPYKLEKNFLHPFYQLLNQPTK